MVISAHCWFICLLAKVTHPQATQPDPGFRKLANMKKFLLIVLPPPPPALLKLHHRSRLKKDTTRTFSKAQPALNFRIIFFPETPCCCSTTYLGLATETGMSLFILAASCLLSLENQTFLSLNRLSARQALWACLRVEACPELFVPPGGSCNSQLCPLLILPPSSGSGRILPSRIRNQQYRNARKDTNTDKVRFLFPWATQSSWSSHIH